jgi:metal-responsive CopG/Arc/MetJ family transcriptional regulator
MVGVKMDPEMIAEIDEAADASQRTRSEMIRRLLAEAVAARKAR